jgi:hypothetical protein
VRHHLFRVGRAEAEEVGHPETVIAVAFGKTRDAAECGVELGFVGGAGVEADPHDEAVVAEQRIPAMNQAIAMDAVRREVAGVFQGKNGNLSKHKRRCKREGFVGATGAVAGAVVGKEERPAKGAKESERKGRRIEVF